MSNIRLTLSYDGTNYAGWQIQPSVPTVQGALEQALLKLTGKSLRVLSAGRTDSGVHALGQVASFQSDFPIPPHKWRPALQTHLPPDVVILESYEVAEDFHATFSAKSKRYRYVIRNHLVDDPFARRFSWRISQPLDVAAMHAAAQQLVGEHDFRSFETDWPNKATSVRHVKEITLGRCRLGDIFQVTPLARQRKPGDAADSPMLYLEIEANGFLYNMVRTITGTLVNVGRGTWAAAEVQRVLRAQDRSQAGATAPAQGLFMVYVNYTDDEEAAPASLFTQT